MSSDEPESVTDLEKFSADLAQGLERCRHLMADWRLKIRFTEAQAFASASANAIAAGVRAGFADPGITSASEDEPGTASQIIG